MGICKLGTYYAAERGSGLLMVAVVSVARAEAEAEAEASCEK